VETTHHAERTDDPGPGDAGAGDAGTDLEKPAGDAGSDTPEPPLALGAGSDDAFKTRFLIPLLLPLLSMLAVAVYVLNISRVFLSGSSTGALIVATIITVSILGFAALISAHPRLRTSSLTMVVALVVIIVIGAGLTTIGPSLKSKEAAKANPFVNPSGAAVAQLNVTAESTLTFDASAYPVTVPGSSGVVQVNYSGATNHTLAIDNPKYNGFQLSSAGSPRTGKVLLSPGTYTIYCTIDSHRALGMQATVTVTAASGASGSTGSTTTTTTAK
jgi:plastocyanin